MNPVEVITTLFSTLTLGLLIGKQVADICSDKWVLEDKNFISTIKCYGADNRLRCISTVILIIFLAFLYFVNGIAIASIAIVILASLAPLTSFVFSKGHSDVEVCQEIEEDKCNIGRSLAINFFINYLDKILDVLPEFLESYKLSVDNQSNNSSHLERDAAPLCEDDQGRITVVKKLFILIPKSGNNKYDTLTDADDNMKCISSHKVASTNISGHKKREYIITSYQLTVEDFSQYHFMAEFATPLSAIYHVQNLPKKSDKRATSDQVEIFYNSLVELLKKDKKKYGDIYCPLYYDDTCDDKKHSLSKALRQELIKKVFEV